MIDRDELRNQIADAICDRAADVLTSRWMHPQDAKDLADAVMEVVGPALDRPERTAEHQHTEEETP